MKKLYFFFKIRNNFLYTKKTYMLKNSINNVELLLCARYVQRALDVLKPLTNRTPLRRKYRLIQLSEVMYINV